MQKQPSLNLSDRPAPGRRRVLLELGAIASLGLAGFRPGRALAAAPEIVVYKDPSCGCCSGWVRHLRAHGFAVTVHDVEDMDAVKRQAGIPASMESCHTAMIDGYLIEGHVPAADILRLLAERPPVHGLAAPGMPASAPGMDMPGEPYTVYAFLTDGRAAAYATH